MRVFDRQRDRVARRVETIALADGARARTEVLWINPTAARALGNGPLFLEAAE